MSEMWSVPRAWSGPAFILGGGPSVAGQDLSRLAGHRVIAINSAWRTYPAADVLFFGDEGWWRDFGQAAAADFAGRMVTIARVFEPRVARLLRIKPPTSYLARQPGTVAMLRTSVTAAVNIAWHYGCDPIALVGVDLTFGPGGRRHHHGDVYARPPHRDWRRSHREELEGQARELAKCGVTALNCSPVSEIADWRNVPLDEAARQEPAGG